MGTTISAAYVTTYRLSDIHAWSGSGYFIQKALQHAEFGTTSIGELKYPLNPLPHLKAFVYPKLLAKAYRRDRDPTVLKHYAAQVQKRLKLTKCDLVFSPGTTPVAYLRADKPLVFWTDATFAGMIDFYPSFSNLCAETIRSGNTMEQAALSNCRLALYSSEWAADTAIKNYDVDPRKIGVVPFGANIQCERTAEDINRIAIGKDFKTCRLLFIGAEWSRKGGDIAVKTAQLLNQRGTKTELHCVGCDPPCDVPDFVKLHGFLSKATEKGRNALDELFRDCHFLVLPTRADCVPMVLAEASSFGLPSLTTKVGGISTAVRDGYNGQTFSLDDGAEQYSDFIAKALSSRHDFEKLSLSSFMEYTERLNWSFAGRKVRDLIRGIL